MTYELYLKNRMNLETTRLVFNRLGGIMELEFYNETLEDWIPVDLSKPTAAVFVYLKKVQDDVNFELAEIKESENLNNNQITKYSLGGMQ